MSQEYKKVFYERYLTTHNSFLYGQTSLESIRRKFGAWDQFYRSHLPGQRTKRILDIGCGDGSFVYYLQQMGYSQVFGVDVSSEQISLGAELGIKNLEVADLVSYLKSSTNKFDVIVARDVIEHFTRQEAYEILLLVYEALTSDGIFMMQVPNGQGLFYTSIFYGDFTHEMAYTESSVRQLFLNAGFNKSMCFPTGPVAHSFKGRLRKALWKLKVLQLKFWKLVETGNGSGIFTSNIIAVGRKECV